MTVESTATPGADRALQPFSATALMASLTVKDLSRSMAWYRDVVGFTVESEMERDGKLGAVRLAAGPVRFLLNQDDGGRGWERVKGEGFSLTFNTTQSVDEIANRIRAQGGVLDTEPADMPWGVRMFRIRDPDGYKLSISAPR